MAVTPIVAPCVCARLGGMILVSPFISIRAAARHIGGRLVAFLFSNVFQNQRRPWGTPGDGGDKAGQILSCVQLCEYWITLEDMMQDETC